jgi:hypothetical protein
MIHERKIRLVEATITAAETKHGRSPKYWVLVAPLARPSDQRLATNIESGVTIYETSRSYQDI